MNKKIERKENPERIVIEMTAECNLCCRMCPRNHIKLPKGFMKTELWTKLIDEITEKFPNSIVLPFWRGESVLHPHFTKLCKYAFQKGIRMHFSTNGHIIPGNVKQLLHHFEFLTFSIHTPQGFKHANEIVQMKEQTRMTQISFVESEKTVEYLNSLLSQPDMAGFDSIRLYKEHTINGIFGSDGMEHEKRIFCPKLLDTLVIAIDGSISRCNHLWETENKWNANHLSISEIWQSPFMNEIMVNYPDSHCMRCSQWHGHTMGERWEFANGKINHVRF